MTPEELQEWLDNYLIEISMFMDYEPSIKTEESLRLTLEHWFADDAWKEGGHRFVHLGIDGRGSQFALWIRPGSEDEEPPVVYFGSEGGGGVIAASPKDWALAVAHAPGIDEYPSGGGQSVLDPDGNWKIADDDPGFAAEREENLAHLETYRSAVEERFGAIPDLDELTDGLDELRSEFAALVG